MLGFFLLFMMFPPGHCVEDLRDSEDEFESLIFLLCKWVDFHKFGSRPTCDQLLTVWNAEFEK
jgi:hypothetical protein